MIGNGIKFTETGGVTVAVDVVAYNGPIARIRFEIADTGIGIAYKAREKIFESFVQADQSILDRFGGTGLGLSIARKSVQLLGGEIGVDSAVGLGSTFWFELDFAYRQPPITGREAFRGMQALLLSRHPKAVASTIGRLTEWGVQVKLVDAKSDHLPIFPHPARGADAGILAFVGHGENGMSASSLGTEFPLVALCDRSMNGLPPADIRRSFLSILSPPFDDDDLMTTLDLVRSRLPSATAEPDGHHSLPFAKRGLHILVADDNGINRKVLGKILESAGHSLTLVSDGEAALDLLGEQPFDVAVIDVNMPVMNGIELVKHYRVVALGQERMPIIGLTADITPQTRQRCLDAGMDACLTKPVEPAALVSAIDVLAEVVAHEPARLEARYSRIAEISRHPRFRAVPVAAIDRKVIQSLAQVAGNDFVDNLTRDFVSDTRVIMERMRAAAAAGDVAAFRSQAHAMRSSAANFGAVELCRLCLPWQTISGEDWHAPAEPTSSASKRRSAVRRRPC